MGYQKKEEFKPTRGYTYARNSPTKKKNVKIKTEKDKEIKDLAYSIVEQQKKTQKLAELDEVEIIKTFYDEYTTGKLMEYMIKFNKMVELIIDKGNPDKVDIIYCWRVDRFGRNQHTMITTAKKLQEHNVYLKFVDGGFDTSSTIGRMMMGILSSFAEWQREEIVINTSIGREREYKLHPEKFGRPKVKIDWKRVNNFLMVKDEKTGKYSYSWSEIARTIGVATATLLRRYRKEVGEVKSRRI